MSARITRQNPLISVREVLPKLAQDQVATRAAAGAASHRIMRPNGPLLGVCADSLWCYGTSSISSSGVATRFPTIGHTIEWLSHGRVKLTHAMQDPGDTMADVLTTQLPALLASEVLPNACVIAVGRNDAGSSFDLAAYLNSYADIARQLFEAGICPIFVTPMPTGAAGAPTATADANLRRLRVGLQKLGPKLGVPVFDQYNVLADEAGGLKAAYNQGDNTHLTTSGYRAVAESLITQGFLDLFPAPAPATIKDTANATDLLAGVGLFKDAVPSGFSVAGTGTTVAAYETPAEVDGLVGRWAKIAKADGSTATGAFRWVSGATVTPGKTYRVSGRLKLGGAWDAEAGNYIQVVAEWRAGSTTVRSDLIMNRWDGLSPVTFSEDFVPPATVDGLRYVCYLVGTAVGEQIVYIGEWSALNLTDMGL